ncbi:MAG: L,D-transpeptidase family protein [Alphaproteobacteria bacterium]|nr:L,D-transpeptidase family protein [Alphaproteobacteria bacterium]
MKALSLVYLASASAFCVAIAINSGTRIPGAEKMVALAAPLAKAAAATLNEKAVQPSVAWAVRKDKELFAWMVRLNPPAALSPEKAPVAVAKKEPAKAPPRLVANAAPALRPAILGAPQKQVAAPPEPHLSLDLAPQAPEPPNLTPAPEVNPPDPAELTRVLSHMKLSLTKELYENFDLFLYVSKADHGPWSQRMYVFQKQASGDLKMLYDFPVSTGREVPTPGPTGRLLTTNTPPGYYELDPDRMYRRYHSHEWNQPMPYAMFFTWEKNGYQTGLAIHGATGADISLLGQRASAGCVRLDPRNARLLFQLIHKDYKGLAPRFAYNRRTATMSNDGLLMHDKAGNLQFAEGYKVLVFIENNGGDNIVAALF